MPRPYDLSEEQKKQFASFLMLDMMVNEKKTFPVLLERDDRDLEPILEHMMVRGYVEIVKNENYVHTSKGEADLKLFMMRYTDFLRNFDVFCAVDLEAGNFAFEKWFDMEDDDEWDAYLDGEHWEDLRVLVVEYKELDPIEIVFMSFINEGRFDDEQTGWQFDLLLGSVWDEIVEICNSALTLDDLAYEDEDGQTISGEAVLTDIIKQGAELNLEIKEEEARLEAEEEDEDDDQNDANSGGSFVQRIEVVEIEPQIYYNYRNPRYYNPVWKRRWF